MIYRVTLYAPDPYEPGWKFQRSWLVGTERAAELSALAALGTVFDSKHGYRVNRRAFCAVGPTVAETPGFRIAGANRRTDGHLYDIDQPVIIVPSVGELGWTP